MKIGKLIQYIIGFVVFLVWLSRAIYLETDQLVKEFYIEDHWKKVPHSWRQVFDGLDPRACNELLNNSIKLSVVWPLSILSLRNIINRLAIKRTVNQKNENSPARKSNFFEDPKMKKLLSKGIKLKKKHEIDKLAAVCAENAEKHSIQYIVDLGAGVGHLARRLTFQYSMKVCCFEMQDQLNKEACQLDEEFFLRGTKCLSSQTLLKYIKPAHLTMELTQETTSELFMSYIKKAFNLTETDNFRFGLVGLHPCGNLSAILLNLFLKMKEAKFLCVIGCCYMKLNTNYSSMNLANVRGYPLSQYLLNHGEGFSNLTYESREVACHALENYVMKLEMGNFHHFKIHAYRATLERILEKFGSSFKRIGLKSVKNATSLTFPEYAKSAVAGLNIILEDTELSSCQVQSDLRQWKKVVFFYTLRVMFAPLIESIILYDRLLYLLEHRCNSSIMTIFDPLISPRNHIIIASKS